MNPYQFDVYKSAEEYVTQMPFDRLIGLTFDSIIEDGVMLKIDIKEELIGNPVFNVLHGGVILSALDVSGAVATFIESMREVPPKTKKDEDYYQSRVSTVGLRVDFLLPGEGPHFTARAHIIRTGRRIAVFRMEMYNKLDQQIAIGAGTYTFGILKS